MFRVVALQVLTTVVVSLGAGLIGGRHAAVSAMLGGASVWIPSGLFALKLASAARSEVGTGIGVFFVGEFVKVLSTLLLLALAVWLYRDIVWLALLVSVIAALKSYVLALFIK